VFPSNDNIDRELANVTSAQNCHRLGDPTQGTTGGPDATSPSNGSGGGTGGGWNKVSPRKELPVP
jgi:hypothetical protein